MTDRLTITITGPQGSGKTQLALLIDELLRRENLNTYVIDEGVSVDDPQQAETAIPILVQQ